MKMPPFICSMLSSVDKQGLNLWQWLWMEEYCHVSLKAKDKAYVGNSCVWWNEI